MLRIVSTFLKILNFLKLRFGWCFLSRQCCERSNALVRVAQRVCENRGNPAASQKPWQKEEKKSEHWDYETIKELTFCDQKLLQKCSPHCCFFMLVNAANDQLLVCVKLKDLNGQLGSLLQQYGGGTQGSNGTSVYVFAKLIVARPFRCIKTFSDWAKTVSRGNQSPIKNWQQSKNSVLSLCWDNKTMPLEATFHINPLQVENRDYTLCVWTVLRNSRNSVREALF